MSFKFTHIDNWGGDHDVSFFETEWNLDIVGNNFLLEHLFKGQLEHKSECIKTLDTNSDYNGRILIAELDLTHVDGASEAQSRGVIDGIDYPPIDTWFYKTKNENGNVLFAWIPVKYVELVEEGIAVNVIECFYWGEDYLKRYPNSKVLIDAKSMSKVLLAIWSHIKKIFS